jgi:predicted regulator of Ras-like GTPase activity (Roadblock/LC7/MglB family)
MPDVRPDISSSPGLKRKLSYSTRKAPWFMSPRETPPVWTHWFGVVGWREGTFEFLPDLEPEIKSIDLDLHRAVMQALKIHDELKAEEERRASENPAQGETDEAITGKLAEFLGSYDFAEHVSVLDSDGRVRASADSANESPDGIEELRSTLHSLMQSHQRGTLNRILIEDNLGTVVLVRLRDGGGLIVLASAGASLGAVSMSVGRLAQGLE